MDLSKTHTHNITNAKQNINNLATQLIRERKEPRSYFSCPYGNTSNAGNNRNNLQTRLLLERKEPESYFQVSEYKTDKDV